MIHSKCDGNVMELNAEIRNFYETEYVGKQSFGWFSNCQHIKLNRSASHQLRIVDPLIIKSDGNNVYEYDEIEM